MNEVSFAVAPTPRDTFLVAAAVTLRARLTLTALAAGPVLWLVGAVISSEGITRTGMTLLPLSVGAAAFVALTASYAAYRPGSADLYGRARWTFTEEGIGIARSDERRCAQWGDFRSWRIAGDCYLLDVTRSRYVSLPVRDVPDGERAAFEALLAAKLGPRRR